MGDNQNNSEKYITELNKLFNDVKYDPYAMLNLLDKHDNDRTDKNIPNFDKNLRRKFYKKSLEVVRVYHFFEVYETELRDKIIFRDNKIWQPILQQLHDLYIYQIEPEIIEQRIKYSSEKIENIDYHEDRHLSRYNSIIIDNGLNAKEFTNVNDIPMNPTFEIDYETKNKYSYYHQRYNFNKRDKHVVVRSNAYEPIDLRFGMIHSSVTNSSVLSRAIFTHSQLDYIFNNVICRLLNDIKNTERKKRDIILYETKLSNKIPHDILMRILNNY